MRLKKINIPKDIHKKVNRLMKITHESKELITEIFEYVKSIGIDNISEEFTNGIGVRLHYGEFRNAKEFSGELEKFANGEKVG